MIEEIVGNLPNIGSIINQNVKELQEVIISPFGKSETRYL